jgi:epoxyqueuosine reductase
MIDELTDWAVDRGYEIAWGPLAVLDAVRADIDGRRHTGELSPEVYHENLRWFKYPEDIPLAGARSVIVVAVPRPTHTVVFSLEDGALSAVIPPTYVDYGKIGERVCKDLAESVFAGKAEVVPFLVPLKALATRLGLAAYGRNNITYTERFGSYQQLVGAVTDVELACPPGEYSAPPAVMPECESCDECLTACPTGAIGEDRFLLHTELCLTHHNERERDFPEWIPASVHHCLVGCMACQEACPQNAGRYREESTGLVFSLEETNELLGDVREPDGTPARRASARLQSLGMTETAVLGRNLRALVKRRECSRGTC